MHQQLDRSKAGSVISTDRAERYRPSLATALSLFVIAAAIVLMTGIGSVVYIGVGESLSEIQEAAIERQMQHTRQNIDTLLDHYSLALQDKARFPVLIQGVMQPEIMEASLADFMDGIFLFGKHVQLALLDYKGRLIHATKPVPRFNYQEQYWLKDLADGTITSHTGITQTEAEYFWHVAVPVRFNRQTEGFVVAELPFSDLHQAVLHTYGPLGTTSRLEFLHKNQLVESFGPEITGASQDFDLPSLNLVLRFFWDREAMERKRQDLLLKIIISLSILTVIILCVALLAGARHIAKPLGNLRRLTHTVATGSQADFVPEDFPLRELRSLSRDFSLMAERIKRREKRLENEVQERKLAEERLFEEKERAQVTLHSIGDAVISTDAEGRVAFLNPIAEALTGWQEDEAKGRLLADVFRIINDETRESAEDPVARCLKEGKIVGLANHTVLLSRSGQEYAIEDSAAPICSEKGAILGVVLVFKDVTEARRLSRQVSYQAAHDTLTGLINRAEFNRRLRRVLETAQANATENALAYLDLDQFKLVNDTCGHVAGDELLRQIGQLMDQHIRRRDTLARLGGDEFGLLMEHCSLKEAQGVAENLIKVVSDFSFPWEEHSFSIGVSIGLVSVDRNNNGLESILSAADRACYMAKERGRNRVHVHKEDDKELAKRHGEMQWAVRLPRAQEEDRFIPYFQKMAPTEEQDGTQTTHYELLLRMKDETGNLVLPSAFLSAAERYNLSDRLDRWMIARAFRWLRAHPAHMAQLRICSINLSGLSLSNKAFLSDVIRELEESGIAAEKICFEITETVAIANLSSATKFIGSLTELGCRFALDDFGSGLSSFAYLKNLPVDFLKIDGLFVKDILDDAIDLAMVRSINDIGHVMGKKTIAEFVESDAILDKLKEMSVDYVQGYAIGRPRPLDEVLITQ